MKKLCLFILICLIFWVNPSFAAQKRKPVELEIPSFDGFKLSATLDVPDGASLKNKVPMVIFLHSICQSQGIWEGFPKEIKDSLSVATLNIDLRGHGKSVKTKKNKGLYWQDLQPADYKKMPDDILEPLKFIRKNYPEVDSNNIAIIGASLGATVGTMAASFDHDDSVKTVIMISPMLEYKGFDMRLPIVKYGAHPILILVSKKDRTPYNSSVELIKFAQGRKQLKVFPFGGNSESLLKFQPEAKVLIKNWLEASNIKGKIIIQDETTKPKPKPKPIFKDKTVGEYTGKVKKRGDIYGGLY